MLYMNLFVEIIKSFWIIQKEKYNIKIIFSNYFTNFKAEKTSLICMILVSSKQCTIML